MEVLEWCSMVVASSRWLLGCSKRAWMWDGMRLWRMEVSSHPWEGYGKKDNVTKIFISNHRRNSKASRGGMCLKRCQRNWKPRSVVHLTNRTLAPMWRLRWTSLQLIMYWRQPEVGAEIGSSFKFSRALIHVCCMTLSESWDTNEQMIHECQVLAIHFQSTLDSWIWAMPLTSIL